MANVAFRFEEHKNYLRYSLELIKDFESGAVEFQEFVWRLEDAALSAESADDPRAGEFYEVWSELEIVNALMLADAERGYTREDFDPNAEIPKAIAKIKQFLTSWAESQGVPG
ncbi:hypothetical protein [Mycolicibacterium sp. J2]|jgi:hypothetical protein|uniref:hypothetical protein n=1 Tax=Mycolicibacterium sp. J2 TaxID=2993511 RepID=UPI00224A7EDE|nr:hypothetical protein [Mycolicibacterium sp. J2]MCX2714308.1 hypothetical protein [Mycolicibacterium sp. J2]